MRTPGSPTGGEASGIAHQRNGLADAHRVVLAQGRREQLRPGAGSGVLAGRCRAGADTGAFILTGGHVRYVAHASKAMTLSRQAVTSLDLVSDSDEKPTEMIAGSLHSC